MFDAEAVFDFSDDLPLSVARDIVVGRTKVVPSVEAWSRCQASYHRLREAIADARHIYGVTTGFGPLANRLIDPVDGVLLQQNLVHHLATGLGAPFDWAPARAICLARLASIMRGQSGASNSTIGALVALLNSNLAPVIPQRGTVGASGDLTPLAHMVLALQGRGALMDSSGRILGGLDGLDVVGIAPLDLSNRDALALVNGTSAMTGIAIMNCFAANCLVDWSLRSSSALLEALGGRSEAWLPQLASARRHKGQIIATQKLNSYLVDSKRPKRKILSARRLSSFATEQRPGQDPYSLRCVPQIVGAVVDTIEWHEKITRTELNSVSDNPIFPENSLALAIHGGNFMGQHIALASDSLGNAIVVLAGLAERQVALLTDEKLNCGLPPFLQNGIAGLNSGFMGAQVTATATLAEARSIGSACTQSISTNASNQDVVSMGTISARNTQQKIQYAAEIIAILSLSVAQAIDLRIGEKKGGFSKSADAFRAIVRSISPQLEEDRPLAEDISEMAQLIISSKIEA